MDWGQYVVGLYLENCLQTFIIMKFFPSFSVGNSWSLSKLFRYTLYQYSTAGFYTVEVNRYV